MRKADNLPPSCAVVKKSGDLNFLEPSGPVMGLLYLTFTSPIKSACSEFPRHNLTKRADELFPADWLSLKLGDMCTSSAKSRADLKKLIP